MKGGPYLNNPEAVYPHTVHYKTDALDSDLKAVARGIVPSWSCAGDAEIGVDVISGGITNLLYRLRWRTELGCTGGGGEVDRSVLVRVYGENTEVMIDREMDNRMFARLSQEGFAPTFHGRFENGRIEGYMDARPLEPSDMASSAGGADGRHDFQAMIARELARMHALRIPTTVCDDEPLLWTTMHKWAGTASGITFKDDPKKAAGLAALNLDDMICEVEWMRHVMNDLGEKHNTEAWRFMTESVFSHQDLLAGNILHNDDWRRVQFIDFEYGGYNFRGFDIGDHFCEYAGFDCDWEKGYPGEDSQRRFLRAYVAAALAPETWDALNAREGAVDEFVDQVGAIVNKYACAAHLFWGLWGIIQAKYSPIDFDFLDYARMRFVGYRLHRSQFFSAEQRAMCTLASPRRNDKKEEPDSFFEKAVLRLGLFDNKK